MKIIKVKNYDDMSKTASDELVKFLNENKKSNVCFATGSTPVGMYKELIKSYKEKNVSFSGVTTFNLDEYVNLDQDNPCSYHYYMYNNLFNHVDIDKKNINFPNGIGNVDENAKKYTQKIKDAGGIDFMILGIGTNAHIAFNEPGSSPEGTTRVVQLTKSTIESNKIFFEQESDVPKFAVSMGIGEILSAKKIILLASGSAKAKAIYDSLNGEITANVPGSFLQNHKDVTVIVDEEAAALLK